MREKRKSPRVSAAVKVVIETDHDFYAGITGDLSYGGVFVVTENPPPPGTEVRLAIRLPDGGIVRAQGSVRWTRPPDFADGDRPPGCGVAWRALDRRSTEAVRHFLEIRAARKRRELDPPQSA